MSGRLSWRVVCGLFGGCSGGWGGGRLGGGVVYGGMATDLGLLGSEGMGGGEG